MLSDYRIIAWDFEIKQNWWCVTFGEKLITCSLCESEEELDYTTFQTGQELQLIDYIIKNKSNSIFVGYNSTHFDNWCLKCIWYGVNPWKVVHQVIELGLKPHTIQELQYKKNLDIMSFDLMQSIGPNAKSLKDAEACMGIEIILDDNVDKVTGLTKEEKEQTIRYNRHDVFATMCLYDRLEGNLESYVALYEKFNLPKTIFSRPKAQLFDAICVGKFKKPLEPYSFKYKAPQFITLIDDQVKKTMEAFEFTKENEFEATFQWDGYDYVIKRGGAHYARKNYIKEFNEETILVLNDFSSFYPGLMSNPTNPELRYIDNIIDWKEFRKLVDMRLEAKKEGNKALANGLKVPVNAAYGKLIDRYSDHSYWPAGLSVCLTGQLITIMICQELKRLNIGKLIQVNTDGFYYELKKNELEQFSKVMDDFQAKIGIEFERDIISKGKIVQKDVNNYVIYDEGTGHVKAKGSINKYKSDVDYYTNSCTIVDYAVAENLIHNTPITQYILDSYTKNEVSKFQIVYNMSSKYQGCYYGNKKIQKVNRGFAVSDISKPDIRKLKGITYAKFADCPDHVLIYNKETKDLDIRKINLDVNWYINLAKKVLKSFKGE